MNIKHSEIEITDENPFEHCKLDREKYAKILTNIIESYDGGFVMALNNKWGTGKTTFVKMWEKSLSKSEYETIYFNAWENDFEDNPLAALLGELKGISNGENDNFNKVLEKAALISKNVIPGVTKAVLNKYLDSEVLVESLSKGSKSLIEIFQKDVEEYSKRKKSIYDFRKKLSKYVADNSNQKPLIFIIDELDRCRPNYAVHLLEQIKHFFSVPNIVFILSIDKIQLGNAICGVYGSDKIDTNEYLRRFIDIEYSIPEPDKGKYFEYLYEYFDYDGFFDSVNRKTYNDFINDKKRFIDIGKILMSNISLRQQEKIMSHMRIVLRAFREDNYIIPSLFFFLIYCKVIHPEFYQKILTKDSIAKDLQTEYYKITKPFQIKNTNMILAQIEAYLLLTYVNYKWDNSTMNEIVVWNSELKENQVIINSEIDNNHFNYILTGQDRNSDYYFIKIDHLTNKIELLENFKN